MTQSSLRSGICSGRAEDLGRARMQMEFERNAEGIIDVGQTSTALTDLISGLQADLLKAQQEYQTEIHYVTADAPQMKVLSSRISAMQNQLEQLKAKLTISDRAERFGFC